MQENTFIRFTIASYQGPPASGIDDAITVIKRVCDFAHTADIILFPETFLQGYFSEELLARNNAMCLQKTDIFSSLSNIKSTIIVGTNEIYKDKIYNTAIVIESGKISGKTRKFSTYPPYDYFALSSEFPIFEKNGISYGICICCDINYAKPARMLAKHGAQIIFVPMWNIVGRKHSLLPHMHNKAHLQSKAIENKAWIVCSDVIDANDASVGVGASCIIDPHGNVVCTSQPLTENILIYNIPASSLDKKHIGLDRQKQEKFLNEYID